MVNNRRAYLLCLLVLLSACASTTSKITLEELTKQKEISVGDLSKLNLQLKPGHGLYLFAEVNKEKDVWFWRRPGLLSAMGGYRDIVLIAYVDPVDPDSGTIIWPTEEVGKSYEKAVEKLYPR